MRVLSVIPGPAFGGAHNQAQVLSAPLRNRGIETIVVLPEDAQRAASRLRQGGMEVETRPLHRLRASPNLGTHWELAKTFRSEVRSLRQMVRDKGIDVVQSHGVTNPHGAIAARRAGVASLWQIFDSRAPMPLRRALMPVFLRFADASTIWGHTLADMHPGIEKLEERLTFVFPPVESARFDPDVGRRSAARDELGVTDDEVLIGSVGVLNPQKGHEFTIRAAAAVHRERPDTRFRILGTSSPSHVAYEQNLYREIEMLGLRDVLTIIDPGARVDQLMQGFDVFLMTSVPRSEGMPTVILEAMLCGKPVVATDVAAVGELVEHGKTGFLAAPAATGEIASMILELCSDDARRAAFGETARSRAVRNFNLERLADLHARAYAMAIAHHACIR